MARTHFTAAERTSRTWTQERLNEMFTEIYEHISGTNAVMFTSTGGLAVKLINKTGAVSVKGTLVTPSSTTANAVQTCIIGVPNCIGVFLEDGVADGSQAWVVVSGIAEVYFSMSTTLGHLARTPLSVDSAKVDGQAISEAIPTSPFATDKHFCEIGHILESRTGAGLARVVLHFN